MDITPLGLARNWLPQVPLIVKTAVLSLLGWSENTEHQDSITETIVIAARPILQTPAALLKSQLEWNKDRGIFGRMWISKYVIPHPEPTFEEGQVLGVREAVAFAIKKLDVTDATCRIPGLVSVETEWTGYRAKASHIAPRPRLSEAEMYQKLTAEVDPDCPTLLYLHGGAFCLMDPATHRWTTSTLAQTCRGRVLSVRYRLSPQSIFPAALLDALVVYLALLLPPPGAFHKPIPASQIVIAGDSSGAGLAASLLLLLLTLSRNKISVRFHGRDIAIPNVPCAGLALASPWLDISRALPSTTANMRWDIIAPPSLDAASPPFPPDSIWPTSPPRAETYCTAPMVSHPLVSPLAAHKELWQGSPPVYVCIGWEGMQDETEIFARRVFSSSPDAVVVFDGYAGMPHCFAMIPWNRAGWAAMANWGAFCKQAVSEAGVERRDMGTWADKHGNVKEVRLDQLGLTSVGSGYERATPLDDSMVDKLMADASQWRISLEDMMVREWKSMVDKIS